MRWLLTLLLLAGTAHAQVIAIQGDSLSVGQNQSGQTCCSPNIQGWAAVLPNYFTGVTFVDRSTAGRSTKTAISTGEWAATLSVYHPDFVILALGTNNESSGADPNAPTTTAQYKADLHQMYLDAVADTAEIIFVTPPPHRWTASMGSEFGNSTDLDESLHNMAPYATAMKEQAAADGVKVIDLYTWAKSRYLYMKFPDSHRVYGFVSLASYSLCPPQPAWECIDGNVGMYDWIHWNVHGATRAAEQIVGELRIASPSLASHLLTQYKPTAQASASRAGAGRW